MTSPWPIPEEMIATAIVAARSTAVGAIQRRITSRMAPSIGTAGEDLQRRWPGPKLRNAWSSQW